MGFFNVEGNALALLQADQWSYFHQDSGTYQRHQATKPRAFNS